MGLSQQQCKFKTIIHYICIPSSFVNISTWPKVNILPHQIVMPWLAWRWTVCPAPFLPQLVPARQQHCRGRPLATSYQGHAGSWAASGHGKRYSCRHIYSFIVYLRFFPSLPSFTKGERDKKTIYQLFHFVCVCFATHKYASECKRCIVCRGVYLMLGSGMVCSMYPSCLHDARLCPA